MDTAFGFAGAFTDSGTGWLYLQHRYNDPTTDQFLTIDPLLAITATAYSYADDDPANLTDPTGQAIPHDTTSGSSALQAAQITCSLDKQRAQAHKHSGLFGHLKRWWNDHGGQVLAVAGAVALFSCPLCDAVAIGLTAYSTVHLGVSLSQGHYTDAALDFVGIATFGAGRWAREAEVAQGAAASRMGAKAARLARSGKAYAHQAELDTALSRAEDARLILAASTTAATLGWAYGTHQEFQ